MFSLPQSVSIGGFGLKSAIVNSTLKGYRSTLSRVERFSPYLPATKEAVEKAIGYPGEASINKRISRYDCINRFFKELSDSGTPQPMRRDPAAA